MPLYKLNEKGLNTDNNVTITYHNDEQCKVIKLIFFNASFPNELNAPKTHLSIS